MDFIKLELTATEYNGWPKCKFYIDSDLIEDYTFTTGRAEITLPVDLLDGEHSLIIELYDKTSRNTKFENNQIVQDQLVTLENIYINNIKLPNAIKYFGVYKFNDQTIPQGLTWGCNGQWTWVFETPIVTWVLDKKIEENEKYNPPLVPFREKIKLEQEKLEILASKLEQYNVQ